MMTWTRQGCGGQGSGQSKEGREVIFQAFLLFQAPFIHFTNRHQSPVRAGKVESEIYLISEGTGSRFLFGSI